jgi:hypothetical protein
MDHTMAKKLHRYPRKFKQKLEKVASARDERAATGDPNARIEAPINPLFHNFWRDFVPRNSVGAMINTLDHELERIDVLYHLEMPVRAPCVFAQPPWRR